MAPTKTVDLSNIFLILGNFKGTPDILTLSENSRYKFTPPVDALPANWKGGQSEEQELTGPFLALTFGDHYYPDGCFLGSSGETETCDLQLVKNNKTGISRRHIRFDISPVMRRPRVKTLSTNPVCIIDGDGREVVLTQGSSMEISGPVTIDLQTASFRAWRPVLSREEEGSWREKAVKFTKELLDSLPRQLPSLEAKTNKNQTSNLRFGKDNAVYMQKWGLERKGGHASVVRVQELKSTAIFAAKEPYLRNYDDSTVRKVWEELRAEYEKMIELGEHPNLVKAIDLIPPENQQPPWMIMEWIPCSLDSTKPDAHDIPNFMLQVCNGIVAMHDKDFAHRDLKPENILIRVNDDGLTPKIADFGESKLKALGNMTTITGSLLYMAPELYTTNLPYSKAIDMWSFGLIALELLTDWEPNSEAWGSHGLLSPGQHNDWVCNVIPVHVASAPETFRSMLKGLLCKEPEQRWSAKECQKWLLGIVSAGMSTQGGTSDSKKRPAPASEDDGCRNVRSQHPT